MRLDAPTSISGADLVSALERAGFVVFRRHALAILLERGLRAVAVPNQPILPAHAVRSVRQMSGLSVHELDALLCAVTSPTEDGRSSSNSASSTRPTLPSATPTTFP